MKAKTSKCVSHMMKVIAVTYKSFDPEIIIDSSEIEFFGHNPIKFRSQ